MAQHAPAAKKKASSTIRLKRLGLVALLTGQAKTVASSLVLQYRHADRPADTALGRNDANPKEQSA
jgi:hypothetical protein